MVHDLWYFKKEASVDWHLFLCVNLRGTLSNIANFPAMLIRLVICMTLRWSGVHILQNLLFL